MTPYASSVELTQKLQRTYAKDCVFSKQVWSFLKQWFSLSLQDSIATNGSLHNHWCRCHAKIERSQRKLFDGVMIYFWWNVWKEQIDEFSNKNPLQPRQVALLCKNGIQQYLLAKRPSIGEVHGVGRSRVEFILFL